MAPAPTTPITFSHQTHTHESPLVAHNPTDSSHRSNNIPRVVGNDDPQVGSKECSELDDFKYEERKSSKMGFSQIENGIVSARARWLEPLLSGKRANENFPSLPMDPLELSFSRNNGKEKPSRSGFHEQSQQKLVKENLLFGSTSDTESDFDNSPRLFKHRMPEDEPKPWVEPGTVARGSLWLEPFFTGRKPISNACC